MNFTERESDEKSGFIFSLLLRRLVRGDDGCP